MRVSTDGVVRRANEPQHEGFGPSARLLEHSSLATGHS